MRMRAFFGIDTLLRNSMCEPEYYLGERSILAGGWKDHGPFEPRGWMFLN